MNKKIYVLEMKVQSSVIEYCDVPIEAESHEEALKLFDEDPYNYEWTEWQTPPRYDYEVLDYEIIDSRIEPPKKWDKLDKEIDKEIDKQERDYTMKGEDYTNE
jgi:hypothetical protein